MLYRFFMIFCFFISLVESVAQNASLEDYNRESDILWNHLRKEMSDLNNLYQGHIDTHPGHPSGIERKSDSILREFKNNMGLLALQYVSVSGGPERLYRSRLDIPKKDIAEALKNLPDSLMHSPYVRSLQFHIESTQIEAGDMFYDFEAMTHAGDIFELSSLSDKSILFVYGGLSCMGEGGRDFLAQIDGVLNKERSVIFIYDELSSDLEGLIHLREEFDNDYLWISDFLGDHSPVKIIYGVQTTPTYFIIDPDGKVVFKGEFIDYSDIEKFLLK